MSYKKIVLAALICAAGFARAAQPVTVLFDATASANQAVNIAQITKQVVLLQQQYAQLQQSYNTLNGLRNVGKLMNNDLLAQYLPADYQKAYTALKNGQGGSLAGISGSLNQIAAANQAQSCARSSADPASIRACNQAWQTLSMNEQMKLQTVAMMQRADEDLARARNAQTTQQALMAPMNLRWGANAGNN
jgi:hypothetical protein